MNERRFYVQNITETVSLTGEEYKHVAKVLRLNTGDNIILFNGDGHDYHGEITAITATAAEISITKKEPCAAEPKRYVALFQAFPKGEKTDFIVQKATELGLSELVFFDSEFTVKKGGGKTDRYMRIAVEAAKQCGRASVPKITTGLSFKETLKQLKKYEYKLFANERERDASLTAQISRIDKMGRIALIVGSEGGFSDTEAKILIENGSFSATLGNRILRTETAAVALAAIVMNAAENNA